MEGWAGRTVSGSFQPFVFVGREADPHPVILTRSTISSAGNLNFGQVSTRQMLLPAVLSLSPCSPFINMQNGEIELFHGPGCSSVVSTTWLACEPLPQDETFFLLIIEMFP